MSQPARYMEHYVMMFYTLILTSIFTSGIPVFAAEAKDRAELEERKLFIEKANEEQWERVREQIQEMSEHGVHPFMKVTQLRPSGDCDFYYVSDGSIRWSPNAGQQLLAVEVPEGFVTDLTSIPRIFWQILRPEGRYAYAAVVHDYLYWTQARPREEADQILKFAMEDSKVDPSTVETVYQAVRHFGNSAWDDNARIRRGGERRFLKRFPEDFTVSWSQWKNQPDVFAEERRR